MQKRVVFVTVDVTQRVAPLTSGYLQAYACEDAELRFGWDFQRFVCTSKITPGQFLSALESFRADVYAISCYVWNMGLVTRTLPTLLTRRPDARVILGGPQVMHCAERYLTPDRPSVVICNGEGEVTFSNFLREVSSDHFDLSRVRGLSFYRGDELITTEEEPRLQDLDSIPSPYLAGYIPEGEYTFAHLETTRGCPFKCQYCYWGGAIGTRVHRFGLDRVKEEISWLARNGYFFIFLVDANWGMLQRDVELSEHIAECKMSYGMPLEVAFCSSKNTPERVSSITKVFHDASLLTSQSIALQTMNPTTLQKVSRENIKTSAYERLQDDLITNDISSFVEMIWPLPGETLGSFKAGITRLCAAHADSLVFYPLLLMNNVELLENAEEYALTTERTSDPNSEAEIVIQTREVSAEECMDGWRLIYAVIILYNVRGLYCLANYLHEAGIRTFAELFSDFTTCFDWRGSYLENLYRSAHELKCYEYSTNGRVVHGTCHEERALTDECLHAFASSQSWWNDDTAQTFFEIDLLNRLYVYSNTELMAKEYDFRHVEVLDVNSDGYVVRIPRPILPLLRQILGSKALFRSDVIQVKHRQTQMPMMAGDVHNWSYCSHKMNTIREIAPTWEDAVEASLDVSEAAVGSQGPAPTR